MKRRWTNDELEQHFTLHPDELALLTSLTDHNRLGFAVLLKCFAYEGRFPQNPSSIPAEIVGYIAKQINVPPEAFARYDFDGRSIREHRARIRHWLSFRPYAEKSYLKTSNVSAAKRTDSFKSQKPHFLFPMGVLKKSSTPSQMSRHCVTESPSTALLVLRTVLLSIPSCVVPTQGIIDG